MEKGILPQSQIFFHTASQFAKDALYHLNSGGNYYCSNLYEINRERYEQYLFIHIKKGKMEIHYQNDMFIAEQNSFVFLNCHKPHLYSALEDTIIDWLHFSGNASNNYFELLYQNSGCVFPLEGDWAIQRYMMEILNTMANDKVDEHAASILIQQILYELDKISNQRHTPQEDTIKHAVSYIENHYNEGINLTQIAAYAQLSTFHFSRVFKKQIGYTPYQYLISYRINNAKKLLHQSNLSISEIAYKCGFNSDSHFVTTFKKYTKLSPKKFRNLEF